MSRVNKIIYQVINKYKIPKERIMGTNNASTPRDTLATAARWEVIHELRIMERPLSYPQIGKILNIDHSTCIYAAKKMQATNGLYFEEKFKKLGKQSYRNGKLRNRDVILAKLKKEFEKGIIITVDNGD